MYMAPELVTSGNYNEKVRGWWIGKVTAIDGA